MSVILVLSAITNAMTNMATASRQLFAFARDKGLPAHQWFATVNKRWEVPANGELSHLPLPTLSRLILHSRSLHHRLLRPLLTRQYRLDRGFQPDPLTRYRSSPVLLPDLHLLRPPEASPQRAAAPSSIRPRHVGNSHQHCQHCFPRISSRHEFLPWNGPPNHRDHELVLPGLRSYNYHWSRLLCFLGETSLRRSC